MPFVLVVTCGGHYHMLHIMIVCLLVHQGLEALRDFVFGLKLHLLPRIRLGFFRSHF